MRHWYLLVLLSFLGVAVFGFTAIGHAHGLSSSFCLAEVMNPAVCSEETSFFSSGVFHAGVFKGLSLGVLAAVLALLLIGTRIGLELEIWPSSFFQSLAKVFEEVQSQYHLAFINWLSLQEKRDPSVLA